MPIESIMYFALGALAASLLALLIMPAIWGRAVRLTKKRIEAATPVSLAEFRADKDQLRAEFALATRRLEMIIEGLRDKLAEQVAEGGRTTDALSQLNSEHERQLASLREGDLREADLRRRVQELEEENTALTQRLQERDQAYAGKAAELEKAQQETAPPLPDKTDLEGKPLSGSYNADIDQLLASLAAERGRNTYLEHQMRNLISRSENSDRRIRDSAAATAEVRQALARKSNGGTGASEALVAAEAKLASAESRLTALLAETQQLVGSEHQPSGQLLAEKLTLDEQSTALKAKVLSVENDILRNWETGGASETDLHKRLNDIAADVSVLANGDGAPSPTNEGESLFERVQRFADNAPAGEDKPNRKPPKAVTKQRRTAKGPGNSDRPRDVPSRRP